MHRMNQVACDKEILVNVMRSYPHIPKSVEFKDVIFISFNLGILRYLVKCIKYMHIKPFLQ